VERRSFFKKGPLALKSILEDELQGAADRPDRSLALSLTDQPAQVLGHLRLGGILRPDPRLIHETHDDGQIDLLGRGGQSGHLQILDDLLLDTLAHGRLLS
jgi:hypothetical protein